MHCIRDCLDCPAASSFLPVYNLQSCYMIVGLIIMIVSVDLKNTKSQNAVGTILCQTKTKCWTPLETRYESHNFVLYACNPNFGHNFCPALHELCIDPSVVPDLPGQWKVTFPNFPTYCHRHDLLLLGHCCISFHLSFHRDENPRTGYVINLRAVPKTHISREVLLGTESDVLVKCKKGNPSRIS